MRFRLYRISASRIITPRYDWNCFMNNTHLHAHLRIQQQGVEKKMYFLFKKLSGCYLPVLHCCLWPQAPLPGYRDQTGPCRLCVWRRSQCASELPVFSSLTAHHHRKGRREARRELEKCSGIKKKKEQRRVSEELTKSWLWRAECTEKNSQTLYWLTFMICGVSDASDSKSGSSMTNESICWATGASWSVSESSAPGVLPLVLVGWWAGCTPASLRLLSSTTLDATFGSVMWITGLKQESRVMKTPEVRTINNC